MHHYNLCRRASSVVWLSIILILHVGRAHGIDVSGCGQMKGCFLNPEGCDAASCEFMLTWRDKGNSVFFEMSAPVDSLNSWVAFGLSKDTNMGSTSVIACVYVEATGRVNIEESWNTDGRRNQLLSNPPVAVIASGQNASFNSSRISCSFSRTKSVNNTQVYTIDAANKYHILMAKGPATRSGLKQIHVKKIASEEDVDLTTVTVVGGDDSGKTKRILIKVHGIMMLVAWCIFASFGMLMPRYYKPTWPKKTCCGKAIWFQIHQPFMIITLLITTAAFIIIFVAVKGYSHLPSPGVAHPPLGICVMALVLINPLMAIFRPEPDARRRWIFNLFHFSVGFLAQLASATAVFLGIWQFGLPDWCMVIMAALVAFHMIVELILIVHYNARVLCKCCVKKNYRLGEEIAMERIDERRKEEAPSPSYASDIFKTLMMFVHLLGVIAFSVVLAVKIGMFDGPYRGADIIDMLQ